MEEGEAAGAGAGAGAGADAAGGAETPRTTPPDPQPDYFAVNRASWDERALAHVRSPDYAVDRFLADPTFLSQVVSFDLPRLGDIGGLRGVHLQCHIGTDTISLARLGAHMTGLDFSPHAIDEARRLATACGAKAEFVVSEVYDAVSVLGGARFDLVYTGVGALCWLPDLDRWASVVATLLAPGGRLFLREGHPMLWSLDDTRSGDNLLVVDFPYFERAEPLRWDDGGTYVETDAVFEHTTSYSWSHGLGEVVTAVLDQGLVVTGLKEHESVPWNALPGRMEKFDNGEYRLSDRPWRLAHSYTLQARKPL